MSRRTVVLAEDHADLRSSLRQLLEEEGYRAVEARTGREALDLVRREAKTACLLVLDLMMPDLTGWDVLRSLADVDAGRLAVVVTSAGTDGWEHDVRQFANVVDTLPKPYDVDRFVRIVERHCGD